MMINDDLISGFKFWYDIWEQDVNIEQGNMLHLDNKICL